jgi:hypothetical protein
MLTKIGALTKVRLVSEIVTGITRQPRQVGRVCSAFLVFGVTASLLAACGSAAGSSASGSSTPGSFSAYLSCLSQHGVKLPTPRPSASPRSAGFGGIGGGFGGSGSSADQAARKACASLRPSFGRPGGGFGGFASALASFRSCMSKHGEPIPNTRPSSTPAPSTSPADRFLNGLNPGNAKVAAALKACQSKLPSFFRSPST